MHFQTTLLSPKIEVEAMVFPEEFVGRTIITPMKKIKQDYSSEECSICHSKADGLHYGAISCRSCNAFFRRAVTFNQKFMCRKGDNCDLKSVRCACRACRFAKCLEAGMSPAAVQPKRDPTGTQKNRRPPKRRKNCDSPALTVFNMEQFSPSILPSVGTDSMTIISCDRNSPNCELDSVSPFISVCTPSPPCPSSIEEPIREDYPTSIRVASATNNEYDTFMDDTEEFEGLVRSYHEHLKLMNRAMVSIDDFLAEQDKGPVMRMILPTDVEKLSTTELSGFMYWIEKLNPFKNLKPKDREVFFKMYSVRKLSLDHFYTASKYPELIKKGCFAMLNNTFVPPDRTGFETLMDDDRTRKAKQEHVGKETKEIMRKRREWAIERLFEHYEMMKISDPVVRLGEILLLLPEIELVCDLHCKDFQVAQLFEFCNMSEYWYENVCYTHEYI